ncbi:dna-mediated transposase [Trichonephila clavipes]|nr:dna-mediated transposase [Trichonephila clavipes]
MKYRQRFHCKCLLTTPYADGATKTKQIVAKNAKLGISSLHAWIKCFECLLHISYRLGIKKWSVRRADRPVVDARKKEVQEKFRRQMGLLVDAPKPGFGTTNEGNTARAFFRNPVIASSIKGIDEMLIKKLHVVLTTIAYGYEMDVQKFKEFYLTTAELYVALCPCSNKPQSLHKALIHGGLLVNGSILHIGQMSEEAIEARNKDSTYFREHHSRKLNSKKSMEDMIQMLIVSKDPYIASLRKNKRRKKRIFAKGSHWYVKGTCPFLNTRISNTLLVTRIIMHLLLLLFTSDLAL